MNLRPASEEKNDLWNIAIQKKSVLRYQLSTTILLTFAAFQNGIQWLAILVVCLDHD